MENQIAELLENIKTDYFNWTKRSGSNKGELSEINKNMIGEFNDGLTFTTGQKYIKVLSKNSVWGFIVNIDNDKKFAKGDILKAAGYNAPARNKPRGNILDGGYRIQWTGPLYL
jgi:hypothetical protein